MEEDLYDEFGNYIGPAMGSDESDAEEGGAVTSAWMESHVAATADVEMEEAPGMCGVKERFEKWELGEWGRRKREEKCAKWILTYSHFHRGDVIHTDCTPRG